MPENQQPRVVGEVKAQLRPKLLTVVNYLADDGDTAAFAWYVSLVTMLDAAESEVELIGFSIELSKAAFLGFQYDNVAHLLIDELLEVAEHIAHAFTADNNNPH